MDIAGWLRSLGLEEYETAFRKNKIDATVLPKLTAEDLKDLGVAAVGDRRKLLEAIALLRGDAGTKVSPAEATSTQLSSSSRAAAGENPAAIDPEAQGFRGAQGHDHPTRDRADDRHVAREHHRPPRSDAVGSRH
jgi:SAM domain (Sterile alpha motif)